MFNLLGKAALPVAAGRAAFRPVMTLMAYRRSCTGGAQQVRPLPRTIVYKIQRQIRGRSSNVQRQELVGVAQVEGGRPSFHEVPIEPVEISAPRQIENKLKQHVSVRIRHLQRFGPLLNQELSVIHGRPRSHYRRLNGKHPGSIPVKERVRVSLDEVAHNLEWRP
jgi:hypothetical protein